MQPPHAVGCRPQRYTLTVTRSIVRRMRVVLLARQESRFYFLLTMQANPYRKVLEDDGKGRQLVETESLATWRFLMFKGAC